MENKKVLTFRQAIELGEYKPELLETYEEWKELSPYSQLQYINEALDNRKKRLLMQMGELYNVLNLSLKPEVTQAIEKINKHISEIDKDKEKLFIEYSSKI